jgi:hypothetical protein
MGGLHSLDFSSWYDRRTLWDAGRIKLLAGGHGSSTIAFCPGMRADVN